MSKRKEDADGSILEGEEHAFKKLKASDPADVARGLHEAIAAMTETEGHVEKPAQPEVTQESEGKQEEQSPNLERDGSGSDKAEKEGGPAEEKEKEKEQGTEGGQDNEGEGKEGEEDKKADDGEGSSSLGDALSFMDYVKKRSQPWEYSVFFDNLKKFRDGKINQLELADNVARLYADNHDILERFTKWWHPSAQDAFRQRIFQQAREALEGRAMRKVQARAFGHAWVGPSLGMALSGDTWGGVDDQMPYQMHQYQMPYPMSYQVPYQSSSKRAGNGSGSAGGGASSSRVFRPGRGAMT